MSTMNFRNALVRRHRKENCFAQDVYSDVRWMIVLYILLLSAVIFPLKFRGYQIRDTRVANIFELQARVIWRVGINELPT